MTRYLSPAKIGLLVLVRLYVEEPIPSDAILPILSFVISHLIDYDPYGPYATQSARWSKAERTAGLSVSIKDFERLLCSSPCLLGAPGKRLWDRFVDRLWEIDSLYALEHFFDNISGIFARTAEEMRAAGLDPDKPEPGVRLSRHSLLGSFCRTAQLEYQRLRFQDSSDLWRHYVRYRQPTARYKERKNPAFGQYSFDTVLLHGELEDWGQEGAANLASIVYDKEVLGDDPGPLPVSLDDVDNLLEFQIGQMQKYANRIPLEIRRQFHEMLRSSFLIPSLRHYLTFLDAWRAGDYATAFDFLHRYFDYTMQNRDRLFYQYALMNLAVLQADFGCYKEAVAAMLETVTIARENRDMTCLNFALNWLFHFGRGHLDLIRGLESDSLLGVGKDTLAFLRVKAKEAGMWTLWSSVLLSEAKLGLAHGDSVATTLEHMVRSSQIIVEKNMRTMFGSQLSLYASLWSRLGSCHLATTACEIFLRCYACHAVFDDELKVASRLSLSFLEQGRYADAFRALDRLDQNSLRSWKPRQYWHKYRGIVQLNRDVHHGNLDGAELLLGQLLQAGPEDLEPDMSFLVDSLHIEVLVRRGDLRAALQKVNEMMTAARGEDRDMALQVRLLLVKVSLLDKCGRPQRAFSTAMRAATIALRARLIPSLWDAVGAVSNILVSMGEFEAAAELLTAVIPRSLECESPSLAARLYSFLADANMGLAGAQTKRNREAYLTRAAAAAQSSFDAYAAMEDMSGQCEMMAKKAVIMKLSKNMVRAADCAALYAELHRKAASLRQRQPHT